MSSRKLKSEQSDEYAKVNDYSESDGMIRSPLKSDQLETDKQQTEDILNNYPLTEDTTCGLWFIKGQWLQRLANRNACVLSIYGLIGCIFTASYAYFNATISTLEKRFKIPSHTSGVILVGGEISQLFASVFLSYYAGRSHRPRWVALGLFFVVIFCFLSALPHLIYGSGNDALLLTIEYGGNHLNKNATEIIVKKEMLCQTNNSMSNGECETADANLVPPVLLFIGQFVSGLGGTLYYTLGVSYMDDNIKKSKAAALINFSYFSRLLGPAVGYALASLSLKYYISPSLTPTIDNSDPRWLGAWWFGWIIIAITALICAILVSCFPKTLPSAAARQMLEEEKLNTKKDQERTSLKDLITTCKRLFTNNILMLNNLADVFYIFGFIPYWTFLPKYIEMQYRQSASVSSFVTGSISFIFSIIGLILSSIVISKYKPSARCLAGWNIIVGIVSVIGRVFYALLGCNENDQHMIPYQSNIEYRNFYQCNEKCHCDYVTYSPVCSNDGLQTFISACHAGCQSYDVFQKLYTNCSCISPSTSNKFTPTSKLLAPGGVAVPGTCPVDCDSVFLVFLAVVCLLRLASASGRASNFLVTVRSVEVKDKPVAMGFNLMITKLFANIPSPIVFGYIIDKTCLIWGKTCSGKGNCWLYDISSWRYLMNFTSVAFLTVGTLLDTAVWYYVKNLKIFDEDVPTKHKTEEDDI